MYYLKALRTLSNGKQTEVILTKNSEEQLYLSPISQLIHSSHIFIINEYEKKTLEFLIENLKAKNGYEVLNITSYFDTNDFANILANTEKKTYSNIQFCKL